MLISIITVVYNNYLSIEKAIRSVINQNYDNIEYIIVDGGSTDRTVDIIKKYDLFISKWVSEPDRGIYDAFNKGIMMASGDVIGFLNSDDIYANEYVIEKVVKAFKDNKTDSVYGDLVYVDSNGRTVRYWKAGEYRRDLVLSGWMPPHPTFFVKRQVYLENGLYRTDLKISADYDMCLRLLYKVGISTTYIPETLVIMETGGKSNKSIKSRITALVEDYRAIKDNKAGGIGTLLSKKLRKIAQYTKKSEK